MSRDGERKYVKLAFYYYGIEKVVPCIPPSYRVLNSHKKRFLLSNRAKHGLVKFLQIVLRVV